MARYRVTVTLQAKGNEPVEIVYARDIDGLSAIHAVTSAMTTHVEDSNVPEEFRTSLVSILITSL